MHLILTLWSAYSYLASCCPGADEILLIYEQCRLESAWTPDTKSAWCAGFTEHDLQVSECHNVTINVLAEGYH